MFKWIDFNKYVMCIFDLQAMLVIQLFTHSHSYDKKVSKSFVEFIKSNNISGIKGKGKNSLQGIWFYNRVVVQNTFQVGWCC